MNSKLYVGSVRHCRHGAVKHEFIFPFFAWFIDLEELQSLSRLWPLFGGCGGLTLASFQRQDYHGEPQKPLIEEVKRTVQNALSFTPDGPVRLLTQVRYLGYVFNPVSFYYCYDSDGDRLLAILAEITNTPWGERHVYAIDCRQHGYGQAQFAKAFHVSPFHPMGQEYEWELACPSEQLSVDMRSYAHERLVFSASMKMQARALTRRALGATMIRYPLITAQIVAGIYWQALRLRLKGATFYPHPKHGVEHEIRSHVTPS